jgi:hypothetical protein
MALIEELLGCLDDGRDDAGLADDSARGADRSVPGARGDVPELERELGRPRERVAALIHRRRARMRRLAPPSDPVALDAVGAEHGAQREAHRLEHRPLLDVELEVGGRVLQLLPGLGRAVEVDAVRADRGRQGDTVAIGQLPQLALVPQRAGGGTRAEE